MAFKFSDLEDRLVLNGKATDHIWLMEDGKEPHAIGLRMDCGDSGVVYLTREQAIYLSKELARFVAEPPVASVEG